MSEVKIRGFEVCSKYIDKKINLPKRATQNAGGYDFECAEDIIIPPTFQFKETSCGLELVYNKPKLVPTGIKSYMLEDEALFLYNRSGNPIKRGLVLANSVGIVDGDYFNNHDNEGHIMFAFYNFTGFDIVIKKGERIGQGIFKKYLKADNDTTNGTRNGGFGSTGK